MSSTTTDRQRRALAADLDALMQRVRDLELFTGVDFWAEVTAIASDAEETAGAVARHSDPLADELRAIADDMAGWGGGDDHWDRDDFRNAALSDIGDIADRLMAEAARRARTSAERP